MVLSFSTKQYLERLLKSYYTVLGLTLGDTACRCAVLPTRILRGIAANGSQYLDSQSL